MSNPITDWQLQHRSDGELLLGLSIAGAILDVQSDRQTIAACLRSLETPSDDLRDCSIGRFGPFDVRLNHNAGDRVSIFVNGPDFTEGRCQSMAVWLDKEQLCSILRSINEGAPDR